MKDLGKMYKSVMAIVVETWVDKEEVEKISRKLGFSELERIETVGRLSGIRVFALLFGRIFGK